jgi:predicted nucleic acid-binding protein
LANSFYFDASALAKRYVPEPGTAQVNAIFDAVPRERLHVLNIGMGEIVSILVRRRNAGVISQAYFGQAMLDFVNEIVRPPDINRESITIRLITASFGLVVAHSINCTDALILRSTLAITRKLRRAGDDLVLVASKLCFLEGSTKQSFVKVCSQTEFGNKEKNIGRPPGKGRTVPPARVDMAPGAQTKRPDAVRPVRACLAA